MQNDRRRFLVGGARRLDDNPAAERITGMLLSPTSARYGHGLRWPAANALCRL